MSIYFCLIFIISIFTTIEVVSQRKHVALLTQIEQNICTKTNQLVFSHANHSNMQTTNK
ncbi:hypothetical protein ACE6H2_025108 [Prunus campanulata]